MRSNSFCLITFFMRDMTHLYVWCDSLKCVMWCGSLICVTWRIFMQTQRRRSTSFCHFDYFLMWDVALLYVWLDSLVCVTWLIHMCDMTHSHECRLRKPGAWGHSYVWYDSFSSACRLRKQKKKTRSTRFCQITFICEAWLIHMCDLPRWRVTWLIRMYDMTHWYVWHDSWICMTRLVNMHNVTHAYVWHNSWICMTWLMNIHDSWIGMTRLMSHIWMRHV